MDELFGRAWWMLVLRGAAELLFGMLALLRPSLTLYHRDVRGLFARRRCCRDLVAIQHRSTRTDWWVPLVLGLCSVASLARNWHAGICPR
jgi:uncharacterized membrane protein HdeD (DUF308 family)